eukprot:908072-Amphidinium_carterae.1
MVGWLATLWQPFRLSAPASKFEIKRSQYCPCCSTYDTNFETNVICEIECQELRRETTKKGMLWISNGTCSNEFLCVLRREWTANATVNDHKLGKNKKAPK